MNGKKLAAFAGAAALAGALMVSGAAPAQAATITCGAAQSADGHTVTLRCTSGPYSGYYFTAQFCNQGGCVWTSSAVKFYGQTASVSSGGYFSRKITVTPVWYV